MKTIVLLDIHQGGHHLMYLRIMSKTLLEMNCQVIAFCLEPELLWNWVATHSPNLLQQFKVMSLQEPKSVQVPVIGQLPQPFTVLNRWHHARQILRQVKVEIGQTADLVFFNWLDSYLSAYLPSVLIDQVFPFAWAGLCFQPRLPFNASIQAHRGLVDYHAAFSSRYCRGVGVLDQDMAAQLRQQTDNLLVVFPDVTDESAPDLSFPLVEQIKAQANGRRIVGLIGSLNKRKGLLTLIKAAQQSAAKNWFYVFIGKLSTYTLLPDELQYIQTTVQSRPSNCLFHLEPIPDEPQFNALIDACDVLFAAYEKFPYSSNILTKAAVFEKPVIASEEFCMGKRVRQFQLGCCIPEGDVDSCIEALRKLHDRLSTQSSCKSNFAGYRQLHSVAQVRIAFEEILVNV